MNIHRSRVHPTRAWFVSLVLSLVGCGASSSAAPADPSAKENVASSPSASATVAVPAARPGRLTRAEVMAVLSRGMGDFLARLEVKPVVVANRFQGWRIVKQRPGDPLWQRGEIVPGDVVTAVGGASIERPEQAFAAFQSLAVARELRVTYERNGQRRELVYPIDDAP